MPSKLGRKEFPSGYSAPDFKYRGRPAKDQGDFGNDVGLADLVCVDQFGEANHSKHYHGGVCTSSDGVWWVYLEWGRCKPGKSWNPSFTGQDYQFVRCDGEADARSFFQKQLSSKNTKRLEQKTIGGVTVWAGKAGEDGYLVQSLATREKGLPDAYAIKDNSGVVVAPAAKAPAAKKAAKAAPTVNAQPQVVSLAQALVGGTKTYTRALSEASGVTPTMDAIVKVRDQLIPAAMDRIKAVNGDVTQQSKDRDLRDISKMVYSLVPRYIPRQGISDEEAILSGGNILALQSDLDAFESALKNEDFSTATPVQQVDPNALLNAQLRWLDPRSDEGAWLAKTFQAMTNNRHSYVGKPAHLTNLFAVDRPDRDAAFQASVAAVAAKRKGSFALKANLQPKRTDVAPSEGDAFGQANVIMAIHGTRSVNIAPIMGTNFRLPRSLPGALITGANFGHGVYFATDWKKSYGYTGHGNSYWAQGGQIQGRGFFMFLCDMIMGDAYRAPSTGSWGTPPNGKDSVFGVGGDRGHALQNDEHVIFEPTYQRIRYLVEGTL